MSLESQYKEKNIQRQIELATEYLKLQKRLPFLTEAEIHQEGVEPFISLYIQTFKTNNIVEELDEYAQDLNIPPYNCTAILKAVAQKIYSEVLNN